MNYLQQVWKTLGTLSQSSMTLCDPLWGCSPPGFFIHGISQARILEWVAIPFLGDLLDSGIAPGSPALQADSYRWATREAWLWESTAASGRDIFHCACPFYTLWGPQVPLQNGWLPSSAERQGYLSMVCSSGQQNWPPGWAVLFVLGTTSHLASHLLGQARFLSWYLWSSVNRFSGSSEAALLSPQ